MGKITLPSFAFLEYLIFGNYWEKLGRYIDRAERKDQFSCARICVEVDLEIGLPEAIQLTIADWSYTQELDYDQIPFKCRFCHGYAHFARNCKKNLKRQMLKRKKINGLKSKKQENQGRDLKKRKINNW